MRPLLAALGTALLSSIPAPSMAGPVAYPWPVLGVYDGDTITVRMDPPPPELLMRRVRLAGVDTPERGTRARCPAEAELADRARAFTGAFLAAGEARFRVLDWGKYGRPTVTVSVGDRDLGEALLAARLAQPWNGRGRKPTWCPDTAR